MTEETSAELRAAYREYQDRVDAEKAAVYDRLENARVELSKAMHKADKQGLPRVEIRRIVKAHFNNERWAPLWNAWTPEPEQDTEF